MVDEVQRPESEEPEDKYAEYDNWFDEEEESADDDDFDDEDSSPESDEDDVPEEEAPEGAPETVAHEGTQRETERQEEDPYSWVAELDPAFKTKVESLVNATKSNAGRAAAEARQKAELQARLDRLQAEREAERRVASHSTPSKAVPSTEQIEDMDDDELLQFMEDYPSVAASVEKLIARRQNQTREEVLAQIRPIQQEAEAARVYERKQALRQEAAQIFNTAETGIDLDTVLQSERWKEWVGAQPQGYKNLIANANTVEDARRVLEDFANYTNQQVYALWEQQEAQRQQVAASQADETAARRRSAQRGSTPRSRTAELADRGRSAAYEDYFNEFAGG